MANKILTPITLWNDFDDSLPANATVLDEQADDKCVVRAIRFYGRAVGDERVNIFARVACPVEEGKYPALLILPDCSLTAETDILCRFAELGYIALMPDYRGVWKGTDGYTVYPQAVSYANLAMAERHIDYADETAKETCWYEWTAVARYCLNFLASIPSVAKIGAIGIRAGGDIVWQLAATCDKLACAVPVCAGGWRAYRGINKYGDAPELKMDDERYRYIAGVESQSYAPQVKCPLLMLCSTNDEGFDADRAFDTFLRIEGKQEKTFYFAARYGGHIGKTGVHDLDLFIRKHLKGREVFVPEPTDISIEEDTDGELIARVCSDQNGEVTYSEVYMAEDTCESAMRDWSKCEFKRDDGEDGRVFRLHACVGASRVFAFSKTKYSCGFAVSSKIAAKKLEKNYPNQTGRSRILYCSEEGRASFTLDRFTHHTLADCFLDGTLPAPPVQVEEGPCGIKGIYSPYGLRLYRINDPRYRPGENALLKFDIYCPKTATVQITIRADKGGRAENYTCTLYLTGCDAWTDHVLGAKDFKTEESKPLAQLREAKYIAFYSEDVFYINNLLLL